MPVVDELVRADVSNVLEGVREGSSVGEAVGPGATLSVEPGRSGLVVGTMANGFDEGTGG